MKIEQQLSEVKKEWNRKNPNTSFEQALYTSWLTKRSEASYWHSCTVILVWALVLMLVIYWR